jgi:ribosomal-protein-serine acetyltransferase
MTAPLTLIIDKEMRLRQFTTEDTPVIYSLIDRNREHLSQFGDTTAEKYQTEENVLASIEHPKDPSRLRLGIWANDTYVGTINLQPQANGIAEVGYYLGQEFEGRGYMVRAVKRLVAYAFQIFPEIIAKIHPDNGASKAVLLRAGFHADTEKTNALQQRTKSKDIIYSRQRSTM